MTHHAYKGKSSIMVGLGEATLWAFNWWQVCKEKCVRVKHKISVSLCCALSLVSYHYQHHWWVWSEMCSVTPITLTVMSHCTDTPILIIVSRWEVTALRHEEYKLLSNCFFVFRLLLCLPSPSFYLLTKHLQAGPLAMFNLPKYLKQQVTGKSLQSELSNVKS